MRKRVGEREKIIEKYKSEGYDVAYGCDIICLKNGKDIVIALFLPLTDEQKESVEIFRKHGIKVEVG